MSSLSPTLVGKGVTSPQTTMDSHCEPRGRSRRPIAWLLEPLRKVGKGMERGGCQDKQVTVTGRGVPGAVLGTEWQAEASPGHDRGDGRLIVWSLEAAEQLPRSGQHSVNSQWQKRCLGTRERGGSRRGPVVQTLPRGQEAQVFDVIG